jgi:hypothetical protein
MLVKKAKLVVFLLLLHMSVQAIDWGQCKYRSMHVCKALGFFAGSVVCSFVGTADEIMFNFESQHRDALGRENFCLKNNVFVKGCMTLAVMACSSSGLSHAKKVWNGPKKVSDEANKLEKIKNILNE